METCKSGSEGGCRKPVVYAIRRLCPTLRSAAELYCNDTAFQQRVCSIVKTGKRRQCQVSGSDRGIGCTASVCA